MLTDPKEIEIAKNAQEPGIRNPNRPRKHFQRIINRFFRNYSFSNKTLMDLGPGQYDFGELVREKGGDVHAIELDPVVVELGQYKKMNVIKGDLSDKSIFNPLSNTYDVLFCRGSINAGWFLNNEKAHHEYLDSLLSILKQDGTAWISPCNEAPGKPYEDYKKAVDFQISFFKSNGYRVIKCNEYQARRYGIWSETPKLIFTKNLKYLKLPI